MSKKEKALSYILFFFGLVLLLFSLSVLIYQIYHAFTINWSELAKNPEAYKNTRNYLIIEFLTLAFKIVIACYAVYAKRNLDDTVNPLFTFTCLYFVFVILQSILYFSNGGLKLGVAVSVIASIDIIVSVLFFGITLLLKLDDWFNLRRDV